MLWQHFELAPKGSAFVNSEIAAVSRTPTSMELWFIGLKGSVQDYNYYDGIGWNSFELAPDYSASPDGGIAAVSRIPTSMELWFIGAEGSVQDYNYYDGIGWNSFELAPIGSAPVGSGIAAVSRTPTSMELWFVGALGSVQDYNYYDGVGWSSFELAPTRSASLQGVSRLSPGSRRAWSCGLSAMTVRFRITFGTRETLGRTSSWRRPTPHPPRGIAAVSRIPTSMELWYVGMHINSYEVGGDISGSSWYQDPTVPEPPDGLSGNVNYFLDAGGSVMTGVTVAIRFTQDFVSTSNAFSFQLNCYSPQSTAITTLVQQFVIYASPGSTQLVARIDNWLNGSPSGELLRVDSPLATMPTTTIQAGYEFQFELQTDPSNNVIGCVYTATDATGAPLGGPAQIGIEGQPLFNAPGNATSANLAPIVAMTFNVGGDYGGNAPYVTSGAGTITYSASEVLTVSRFEPSFPPFQGRTQESANVTFGALPQAGLTSITQKLRYRRAGPPPRSRACPELGHDQ